MSCRPLIGIASKEGFTYTVCSGKVTRIWARFSELMSE